MAFLERKKLTSVLEHEANMAGAMPKTAFIAIDASAAPGAPQDIDCRYRGERMRRSSGATHPVSG